MKPENTQKGKNSSAGAGILTTVMLVGVLGFLAFVRPWEVPVEQQRKSSMKNEMAPTVTVNIPVEGMSCGSCAASVKRATKEIEGVKDVEVDLAGRRAKVEYMEGRTSPERIASAISELGYKVGAPEVESGQ